MSTRKRPEGPGRGPLLLRIRTLTNSHLLLLDILVLTLTPWVGMLLRVGDFGMIGPRPGSFIGYAAAALALRIGIFAAMGMYRRYWRYATVDELLHIGTTVFVATLASELLILLYGALDQHMPRSLPLIEGLLILVACGASRFSIRLAERLLRGHAVGGRRVLVFGAGSAGQGTVKELQANPQLGLVPVCFMDDDAAKKGLRIHSLPVLGGRENFAEVVRQYGIQQVIIAMPTAPGMVIREVLELAETAGVPAKTVPGIYEILDGSVNVDSIRNVEIEDLLRRDPVHTDIGAVRELVRGKRVLITGGGGSIGSELCRQVLRCGPAELVLVGHGENSVFETHNELKILQKRHGGHHQNGSGESAPTKIEAVIADVRFPDRIRKVIGDHRPQIVFHAAAHKHVPLMELNPSEAVTNNIIGTRNLLDAALELGVERFVMISTDKAVNPTSIMGASKRAAELLVLRAARESGKPFVAVRFGNVLGSRGSVVLTFKKQIAAGGPVTVSDDRMRRYFMTIPEAVQLVLQAAVLGKGGEVFTLDMGDPVKIVDLARDLIELSGFEVGRDIDIVYTGVRPGEKLYEELFIEGENYKRTHHEKILIAQNASSFVPREFAELIARLQQAAAKDDIGAIRQALKALIPEYTPEGELATAAAAPAAGKAERPAPVKSGEPVGARL
jgi:FlaA1/EpsC-like NDP-sugar epimerase